MAWSLANISTLVKVKTALKILNLSSDESDDVIELFTAIDNHPLYQGFDFPKLESPEHLITKIIDAGGLTEGIDAIIPKDQQPFVASLLDKPQIRDALGTQVARMIVKSGKAEKFGPIIEKIAALPIFLDDNGRQIEFQSVDHFVSEGVLPKISGVLTRTNKDDEDSTTIILATCPFCNQNHAVHTD